MNKNKQTLIGHYYVMRIGDVYSSPYPQNMRIAYERIAALCRRITVHENFFGLDIETLTNIRIKLKSAWVKKDEKLHEEGMNEFLSWAKDNNVWVGKNLYHNSTMKEDYDDYQIGG